MIVLNRALLEHSSDECRISSDPPFYKILGNYRSKKPSSEQTKFF